MSIPSHAIRARNCIQAADDLSGGDITAMLPANVGTGHLESGHSLNHVRFAVINRNGKTRITDEEMCGLFIDAVNKHMPELIESMIQSLHDQAHGYIEPAINETKFHLSQLEDMMASIKKPARAKK